MDKKEDEVVFDFHVGKWVMGTLGMTRCQRGAYWDLLLAHASGGRLHPSKIENILGPEDVNMWITCLKAKFKEDENGLFYNERLEFEINKKKKTKRQKVANLTQSKALQAVLPGGLTEDTLEDACISILSYLNTICNRRYTLSDNNLKYIRTRVRQGVLPDDLRLMIDFKQKTWGTDPNMNQYLRPETLFGNKCEGYIQAAKNQISNGANTNQHNSTAIVPGGQDFGKL
jgi:uncharacterized phage protein (TIGR02220 family)